jgi:hypothetical protein
MGRKQKNKAEVKGCLLQACRMLAAASLAVVVLPFGVSVTVAHRRGRGAEVGAAIGDAGAGQGRQVDFGRGRQDGARQAAGGLAGRIRSLKKI